MFLSAGATEKHQDFLPSMAAPQSAANSTLWFPLSVFLVVVVDRLASNRHSKTFKTFRRKTPSSLWLPRFLGPYRRSWQEGALDARKEEKKLQKADETKNLLQDELGQTSCSCPLVYIHQKKRYISANQRSQSSVATKTTDCFTWKTSFAFAGLPSPIERAVFSAANLKSAGNQQREMQTARIWDWGAHAAQM